MSGQYESLGEKTKLVDISMKYTGGDMEKAKEMAGGNYQDIMVLKGKFYVRDKGSSGIFMAFFNYIDEYISNISSVISSRPELFDKVRIFDDWKTLYKDIVSYQQDNDAIDSESFNMFLMDSFIGYDVFPDVSEKNLSELTQTVTEILNKSFNSPVQCQIEFNNSSSLEMHLQGITLDLPSEEGQGAGGDTSEAGPELSEEEKKIQGIEGEAKFIVEGKAVLSPIKGKSITDLSAGEKIRIDLTGKDVVTDKILKLMNAYDEDGKKTSVPGRIKAIVSLGKEGFIIYAFVAKGVLAKIYEEANVKVLMDKGETSESTQVKGKREAVLLYIMGIIVLLIIIAGLVLLQLL